MLYKALGYAVWKGTRWYLTHKLPPGRLVVGVGLAAVAATAVAVGAKPNADSQASAVAARRAPPVGPPARLRCGRGVVPLRRACRAPRAARRAQRRVPRRPPAGPRR